MNELQEIYAEALGYAPGNEREAFLNQKCEANQELRREVESLLRAHDADDKFLQTPAAQKFGLDDTEGALFDLESTGDTIGPYKLLQKLGEGGFGVVWMAEQKEPIRRKVALKLIKPGMDSKQVLGRFEAERHALAMMDHPNIAKVLDAGVTDNARPYFVMELVRGLPITQFLKSEKLDLKTQLTLFREICHAIHHAHQKGIIHRDIKPNNVLVTLHDGRPVPKVIDFGIAKAMSQDLTDMTVFTRLQEFLGTPAYTSPEQVEYSGLDVDTRTDIYSLGILLYELLTGAPPFDPKTLLASGIDHMRQVIREETPTRPSISLTQTRARARTTQSLPKDLPTHSIPNDLDWIAMKCLEKDRNRRYPSANDLAEDIDRFLREDPIEARPPSAAYKISRIWKRHKLGVSAVGITTVAIISALIVSLIQTNRAQRLAVRADYNARRAERERKDAIEAREASAKIIYELDMNLAQNEISRASYVKAAERLANYIPTDNDIDQRNWEWRHLWAATRDDNLRIIGKSDQTIYSLAISADGLYAFARTDDRIKVYDIEKRDTFEDLYPGFEGIKVAAHPKHNLIATHGKATEGTTSEIRIYDIQTRKTKHLTSLRDCAAMEFSSDGRFLVLLESENGWGTYPRSNSSIRVIDADTFELIANHPLGIDCFNWQWGSPMAISPDGSMIAYSRNDNTIEARELLSGEPIWQKHQSEMHIPEMKVQILDFSPDGQTLALETMNKVALLDPRNGFLKNTIGAGKAPRFAPNTNKMYTLAGGMIRGLDINKSTRIPPLVCHQELEAPPIEFRPNSTQIVTIHKDNQLALYDLSESSAISENYKIDFTSIQEVSGRQDWTFGADSKFLYTVSQNGEVRKHSHYDNSYSTICGVPPGFDKTAFSPYGDTIAALYESDNRILIFETDSGILRNELQVPLTNVFGMKFLRKNQEIFLLSHDINADSAPSLIQRVSIDSERVRPLEIDHGQGWLWNHRHGWAFSRDEETLLTHHGTPPIHYFEFWDLRNWTRKREALRFTAWNISPAALNTDGTKVSFLNYLTYDLTSETDRSDLEGPVNVRAFSRDGTRLATANSGTVTLWSLTTERPIMNLTSVDPLKDIFHLELRFSHDDEAIALRTSDAIHVWRAPPLDELFPDTASPNSIDAM